MDYTQERDLIRQPPTRGPDGIARMVLNGEWRLAYFNVRDEHGELTTDITFTPKTR